MDNSNIRKIVLSRTDNIGDVILTLPLAGYLKKILPHATICFIGKTYTAPIIAACSHVDQFLDRDKILADPSILKNLNADLILHIFPDKQIAKAAYKAGIPSRVGTSHRWYHWLYCNKLANFSRKNAEEHESILNFKLLQRVFPNTQITLPEIPFYYGMKAKTQLPDFLKKLLKEDNVNIILHPKSKGSAREWPLANYKNLALLFSQKKFAFFVTGTETEGQAMKETLPDFFTSSKIHDLTGKLNLGELISFIDHCDGLVACSTGPLHLAASFGKPAIGIYPPMRPIHPGRWGAIGKKSKILVLNKACSDCRINENCHCIASIGIAEVAAEIQKIHAQ